MDFPAADHEVGSLKIAPPLSTAVSSAAPLTDFTKISSGPNRSDAKAMRLPSGDHAGKWLIDGPKVKREGTGRSRANSQISAAENPDRLTAARRFPSGASRPSSKPP